MSACTFIGIDPGKSGAIALIGPGGIEILDCPVFKAGGKAHTSPAAMAAVLSQLEAAQCFAALERVASRPGQGVVSVFSFGENFGAWQGILAALKIPHELPRPQEWQKALMAGTAKDKDAAIAAAARLFPEQQFRIGKNHNRADALLLAEFARRSHQGKS